MSPYVRLSGVMMCLAAPAVAQDTAISTDLPTFRAEIAGAPVVVTRNGPTCPPACVQPMQAADGIATLGELEVLTFLRGAGADGTGLLVDIRAPERFTETSLPGAVNVPAQTLAVDNPYRADLLAALGFDPTAANGTPFDLVLFGTGATDPAPAEALRDLLSAGYPADRLHYYRAGLDGWVALGLSTEPGT